MTSYLITGGGGMLAADLSAALAGRDVVRLTRAELDITDLTSVREAIIGRDVVINAAAYTDVDGAEADEAHARLVNATGSGNLASATAESGARLVQVSTDYVFDGRATSPYPESAVRSPASAYGRSKAEGEELVLSLNPDNAYIVRTAWLYGSGGSNFASTVVRLGQQRDKLDVVTDQVGQPTWSHDVAQQIVALLDSPVSSGIFHATNSGQASWFEFAQAIFSELGWDPERVRATTASAFARLAPRPAYSVLGHDAWATAGLSPLRDWRDALSSAHQAGVLSEPDKKQ
jgi:dTDP-4-dehydrorhamnose reductase